MSTQSTYPEHVRKIEMIEGIEVRVMEAENGYEEIWLGGNFAFGSANSYVSDYLVMLLRNHGGDYEVKAMSDSLAREWRRRTKKEEEE